MSNRADPLLPMSMKLATWNVNSLRVRLEQVLTWSTQVQPTLLALQETKVADEDFPAIALTAAGWHVLHTGQPAYNGVAILSAEPLELLADALPGFADEQRRLLAVRMKEVAVVNVYVPNGQAVGADKYQYKLEWLGALTAYLRTLLGAYEQVAVMGDFNIAPEDCDVYDPAAWEGSVLVSAAERKAFRALLDLGLSDSFRRFDQPEQSYSWWDYRQVGFRRNLGLRIDHILMSPPLLQRCRSVHIDTEPRGWPRPSDHTPVVAELD